MHSLLVNVTLYNAVNMIHDVITTASPFPYTCTAKLMFAGVKNNKNQQIIERLENYQFSQPR